MRVTFNGPVKFDTLDSSFTGDGIPPIPRGAQMVSVSPHTSAYLAQTGEAWEVFRGHGTTETSETYYWPHVNFCPREWAERYKISPLMIQAAMWGII